MSQMETINFSNQQRGRNSFQPGMGFRPRGGQYGRANNNNQFTSPTRNQPLNLSISIPNQFNSPSAHNRFSNNKGFRSPNQRFSNNPDFRNSQNGSLRKSKNQAHPNYIWGNDNLNQLSVLERSVTKLGKKNVAVKGSLFGKRKETEKEKYEKLIRGSNFLVGSQKKNLNSSMTSWNSGGGGQRHKGMPASLAAERMVSPGLSKTSSSGFFQPKVERFNESDPNGILEIRRNIRGISAFNELARTRKGEIIDPTTVGNERVNRVVRPKNKNYDEDVQIIQLKEDKSLIGRDIHNEDKKEKRRKRKRRKRKKRLSRSGSREKRMPQFCGLGSATKFMNREQERKEREKKFVKDTMEEDINCQLI